MAFVLGLALVGLKVVEVDPATGKPKPGAEIQAVAARPDTTSHAIEAPVVIFHQGYYYLFVSWDACCDGAKSTYKVMVGRSREATGPVDRRRWKTDARGWRHTRARKQRPVARSWT